MLDTVLFDLDGTLLPIDLDEFIEKYLYEIGKAFENRIDPKKLVDYIVEGTNAMLINKGYDTNENVFMKRFSQFVGEDMLSEYKAAFDNFYDTDFIKIKSVVKESGRMVKAIYSLKEKGYTLAIATNPIFPRKAIIERIRWAGLEPDDFCYISCFECNTYTKPSVYFFQEVIDAIGKKPEQCMMVGNDVQEDLPAGKLGMATFLIKNYLINRGNEEFKCTYEGYYEDFNRWVLSLKPLSKGAVK